MALKQMLLQKKISDKKKELDELRAQDFTGREAELATAIDEAETDEEKQLVEEEVDKLEAEQKVKIDKKKIELGNIKVAGEYTADIKIYRDVIATIKIVVKL